MQLCESRRRQRVRKPGASLFGCKIPGATPLFYVKPTSPSRRGGGGGVFQQLSCTLLQSGRSPVPGQTQAPALNRVSDASAEFVNKVLSVGGRRACVLN